MIQSQSQPNPLSRWGPKHLFIRLANLFIILVIRLTEGVKNYWRMKDNGGYTEN